MNAPFWKYFQRILCIPRESKHEERMIYYLEGFAKSYKLDFKRDDVGNVLITKHGNSDKSIALQAHMDMVCVAEPERLHNFSKDPIDSYIKGDYVCANGTTLGADDGIGVAMMLSILADEQDKTSHVTGVTRDATIECLFTVDEETGLTGAKNLPQDFIKSKTLINLDSEEEGVIYIGCAGGCTTTGYTDFEYVDTPRKYLGIYITIDGLKGGHSGSDIHRGRANAIEILASLLYNTPVKIVISDIIAGEAHNAIPPRVRFWGAIPYRNRERFRIFVNEFTAQIQEKYKDTDPNITITLETIETPRMCLKIEDTPVLIDLLHALPNGVKYMDPNIPELVETSTTVAMIEHIDDKLKITTSTRSSSEKHKIEAQQEIVDIFNSHNATVEKSDGYPAWTPNLNSNILTHAVNVYKDLYDQDPKVTAIHAGLECGLFREKYPDLDMISIGPNLLDVHTTKERVQISSAERFYVYLNAILDNL